MQQLPTYGEVLGFLRFLGVREFYDDLNAEVFILLLPAPYVCAHILTTRSVITLIYSKQPISTHKCIYLLFCCYKRIFFPTL